jgi:hypothetical protein
MHHTYGSISFANSPSHPLDASSADVAYSEYSWKTAFEHVRRTGKRPMRNLLWFERLMNFVTAQDRDVDIVIRPKSQKIGGVAVIAA